MYGLRGCAPCVSCMGLGSLKELKFLKVCLKSIIRSENKTAQRKSQHQLNWSIIITINSEKKQLCFVYFASKFK